MSRDPNTASRRARQKYEERQAAQGGRLIHVRLDRSAVADLETLVKRHGSVPAAVKAALQLAAQHCKEGDSDDA